MMNRRLAPMAFLALLLAASLPQSASAAISDLPGMQTATDLKDWLKLTDDQVAKLTPVINTRVQKNDAALAKAEAAEKPDVMGFVKEYGEAKKEFDAGVTNILTPDQGKQWEAFKAEAEKSLVQGAASNKLAKLQPALHLTDDQVAKLKEPMTVSIQKKVDVLQKLADSGRIGVRDKLKAKRGMDDANSTLEKAMAPILSPDQIAGYKAAAEAQKKKLKG